MATAKKTAEVVYQAKRDKVYNNISYALADVYVAIREGKKVLNKEDKKLLTDLWTKLSDVYGPLF